MTLATLYNTPTTPELLSVFSFANADEHTKIQQRVLALVNVNLPLYILDPIPTQDLGAWLYQHQQAHNVQNEVLGIAGNDLTDVDFTDQAQTDAWIRLHCQEHIQAAQILGLT